MEEINRVSKHGPVPSWAGWANLIFALIAGGLGVMCIGLNLPGTAIGSFTLFNVIMISGATIGLRRFNRQAAIEICRLREEVEKLRGESRLKSDGGG
jgi:hypothetical protein